MIRDYALSFFLVFSLVAGAAITVFADTITTDDIITKSPWVDVRSYNGDLIAACNASHGKKVLVPSPTLPLSSSYSTPADVQIEVTKGGLINSGSSGLTINGPFSAGPYQVFSGSGTVSFGPGSVKEVYPEWWGVDGTNDEYEVNKAVNSLPTGGIVRLLNKTYNFQTNTVTMKSGVTIRGSGFSVNPFIGTIINTSLTDKGAFTSGSNIFFVGIEHLIIRSETLTTGRNGIECLGTVAGGGSLGFDINHVMFYRLDKGVRVEDTNGSPYGWQYSQISISHSKADECNIVVECKAGNAELRSAYNYFSWLDKGFNLIAAGMTRLEQTFGGGYGATGLNAFVYAEFASHLTLQDSQAEGISVNPAPGNKAGYFIKMPAAGAAAYSFVSLENCVVNGPIEIAGQRSITSIGNLYNGGDTQFTDALITSIGDYYADGAEGGGFVASRLVLASAYATILNSSKSGQNGDGFVHQSPMASKDSTPTITPTGSLFHVTGAGTISTINVPWPGFSGRITIIPDGVFQTNTSGNIARATKAVVGKALDMYFDWNSQKWYPSY